MNHRTGTGKHGPKIRIAPVPLKKRRKNGFNQFMRANATTGVAVDSAPSIAHRAAKSREWKGMDVAHKNMYFGMAVASSDQSTAAFAAEPTTYAELLDVCKEIPASDAKELKRKFFLSVQGYFVADKLIRIDRMKQDISGLMLSIIVFLNLCSSSKN